MDAVEYIKEAKRICKSRSVCKSVSGKCPLLDENGHCTATADICAADIIEKTEKAVRIVEQWAKDNPIKTRQSEFLKKFPNADMQKISVLFPCAMDQTIRPTRCVKYESFSSPKKCVECRKDYWLTEVTNND